MWHVLTIRLKSLESMYYFWCGGLCSKALPPAAMHDAASVVRPLAAINGHLGIHSLLFFPSNGAVVLHTVTTENALTKKACTRNWASSTLLFAGYQERLCRCTVQKAPVSLLRRSFRVIGYVFFLDIWFHLITHEI